MNNVKLSDIIELTRLDKPTGTMLLFWPCAFGVAINSPSNIDFFLIFKFLIGSLIMRSAGCIINDLWDKDFDNKVDRTKTRPIASGKISIKSALVILAILLSLGLAILLTFKTSTILFALLSIPLFIIYPLMKRITFFPQAFLGITFNFGALIASKEIFGEITHATYVLYLGLIFWTIGYDSIYGFMDIKDDKKIGIKSLPILIEENTPKIWLTLFYIAFLFLLLLAISLSEIKIGFLNVIFIMLVAFQLYWQIENLNLSSTSDCMNKFKSNILLGFLIFASLF